MRQKVCKTFLGLDEQGVLEEAGLESVDVSLTGMGVDRDVTQINKNMLIQPSFSPLACC